MKLLSHMMAVELKLTQDEEAVIDYGLFVLLFNGSSLLIMLLLGLATGCWLKTILFTLCFVPLRLSLGGYHCQTARQCFITFSLLSLIFVILVRVLTTSVDLYLLTIGCLLMTLIRNHQTSHHRRTVILVISMIIITLLWQQSCQYIVCLSILMSLILLNLHID